MKITESIIKNTITIITIITIINAFTVYLFIDIFRV